MKEKHNNLAAIAIGVIFFLSIFGVKSLDPSSIAWLGGGDLLQNYLGWAFYRQSPWTFPVIGLSPDYGMEVGSSVVFTDSNPLLAILFKALSPVLPETFQYFGIWLLACCVLQALFSWKIASLYTKSALLKLSFTIILMFIPSWIMRVGHINLMANFLLLAAIYLSLKNNGRGSARGWAFLVFLSCAIHFYIAMMVIILWGSNIFVRFITDKAQAKKNLYELLLVLIVTVTTLFVLGYFTVGNVSVSGGYGYYNNNIFSPLMSSGWSYFFNIKSFGPASFEQFNYWGAGIILLVAVSIILLPKCISRFHFKQGYAGLAIASAACFIIATTNHISIGSYTTDIQLPYKLIDALSIFRASSRFFWVVTYCVVIVSCVVCIRTLEEKKAVTLLSLLAIVQVADTSHGYGRSNFYFFKTPTFNEQLTSRFWMSELKNYHSIRSFPFESKVENWASISSIALKNHLSTDAVYLARYSDIKADEMNYINLNKLVTGKYDKNTVYIIRNDFIDFISLRQGDKLFKVDGVVLLAPGLSGCEGCSQVEQRKSPGYFVVPNSWSKTRNSGDWNEGKRIVLIVRTHRGENVISIKYRALITPATPEQKLIFKVDGEKVSEIEANGNGESNVKWNRLSDDSVTIITIETPNARSPRDIGMNSDIRKISIGIESITLN